MNIPDQFSSVRKKPSAAYAVPQVQITPGSANSQQRVDFGSGVSQFSVNDNSNAIRNGDKFQVQQFIPDNNNQNIDQVNEENDMKAINLVFNSNNYSQKDPLNMNQDNDNSHEIYKNNSKISQANQGEQSQKKRNVNRNNTTETKKSHQQSISETSDQKIMIFYNSEEEDNDELDMEVEEYKKQGVHPLSQKNLNTNPPSQTLLESKITDFKLISEQQSQLNQENGYVGAQKQQIQAQQQQIQYNQKSGEKNQKNNNTDKKVDDIEEDHEEYNVQISSKVEHKIISGIETNQSNKSNTNILSKDNMQSFQNQSNGNEKSPGYRINSLQSNNHEHYLQSAKFNQGYNINQNSDRSSNTFTKTIFEKKNGNSESLFTQNTPQNRLNPYEEKFSTESDRLNEQQYTSYNTNYNQSISPEAKLKRLSQQQIFNQKDSFFKEKDIYNLESEANNEHMEYQQKDKESLIQQEDVNFQEENLYNSRPKNKKNSHIQQEDDIGQKSSKQQESFEHHYSSHKKDMFLDSSHQLKDFEENQIKRVISDSNPKKNLLLRNEIHVSVGDSHELPPDLGKHIGKDITGILNQQSTLKNIQNERVNTKSSSQNKLQPILNKEELEKKKERKIEKFCQKFFKDLLKNRSGVPTLTQNNRKMNIESETPNPDYNGYKPQKSAKEGLLNEDLRKELYNIEEHQKYRLVMDQFLKKFNTNPKDAIQFLIEKQLCDDSEEDIAYMLLTTEGLNKEQLGQFFGGNKERNQLILEAFCSLLDFRDLKFDEAIRLFLSRFRLPGESQQIDRIIQKFTKVYTSDNQTVFQDDDTPYILCYSVIMLNVDAHSEKIEKSKKMQKSTFVNNNLLCTRGTVSKEFLEQLYDNIVKEKFETKVDYIEKIYSRIPIESMKKQYDGQYRNRLLKELQDGTNFLKYGRQGKPHMRKIYINEVGDKIVWNEVDDQVQKQIMANTNQKINHEKKLKQRHIWKKDITDFTLGCNATEVMKKHNIPPEFDQFCFSIITTDRTLDLKAHDMETKFKWIAFIYNHLNDQRIQRKNKNNLSAEQKQINQERINEIWRLDIFSKWDDHWDYANSKPKNIVKYENKVQKSNFFSSICSCLSISKNQNGGGFNKLNSQNVSNVNQSPSPKRDYEELELAHQNNKSLLLISLWKFGMPQWVRKTIWPITVGNRLEITENLYKILLKQVQVSENNTDIANKTIVVSIEKMKSDLKNVKGKALHQSLTEEQQRQLENILGAFIFYRPDVGYINEAMPNLAAILILQLGDEYSVFKTFINLLHSYHFLTFFRGEMSEIKWRVQFFDEYLQQRMPLVHQHFKALDLSSELFLMHWFLNLFSNVFDFETVYRIWDNFLLEGEVFAFKAGIAFIEYFHLEFKMATFDDAITFLKNPPVDIFCHDLYFDIIEDIKIPVKVFNDRLDQQNVAKLAPYILQQLL